MSYRRMGAQSATRTRRQTPLSTVTKASAFGIAVSLDDAPRPRSLERITATLAECTCWPTTTLSSGIPTAAMRRVRFIRTLGISSPTWKARFRDEKGPRLTPRVRVEMKCSTGKQDDSFVECKSWTLILDSSLSASTRRTYIASTTLRAGLFLQFRAFSGSCTRQ